MEGGDEDMEANVTMQPNDKSIRMKNEHDFEQITNQEPLLVQETFAPVK